MKTQTHFYNACSASEQPESGYGATYVKAVSAVFAAAPQWAYSPLGTYADLFPKAPAYTDLFPKA